MRPQIHSATSFLLICSLSYREKLKTQGFGCELQWKIKFFVCCRSLISILKREESLFVIGPSRSVVWLIMDALQKDLQSTQWLVFALLYPSNFHCISNSGPSLFSLLTPLLTTMARRITVQICTGGTHDASGCCKPFKIYWHSPSFFNYEWRLLFLKALSESIISSYR